MAPGQVWCEFAPAGLFGEVVLGVKMENQRIYKNDVDFLKFLVYDMDTNNGRGLKKNGDIQRKHAYL